MATPVTHSPLGIEVREEQQRIVLDALVAADGHPVPYSRLRDAGVEFPASVIAELELAGLSVSRNSRKGAALQTSAPAVRLRELAGAETAEPTPPSVLLLDPPARRGHHRGALIAMAVAIASVLIVLAAAGSLSSRGHSPPARKTTAARPTPHRTTQASPQPLRVAPPKLHRPPAQTPPTPATQASAPALQLSGHQLLADGRYAQATALLRRAMQATGEDVARCAQPVGDSCLVYAYALYDLGRALLLEGQPREATVVLQHRLRIANQQAVVASELALARASATGRVITQTAQNNG